MVLTIADISLEKLRADAGKEEFSEFYVLKKCIEHFPPRHEHESVFDHTLSVLDSLQNILNRNDTRLQNYLEYKSYKHYSRRDLLYLMTALHDIAKPETLVKIIVKDISLSLNSQRRNGGNTKVVDYSNKGYTSCPNHDKQGASKARRILPIFDVNYPESEQIAEMIWLHKLFCFTKHPQTPDEDYKRLQHLYPHIYCDMFLFELADTQGLHVTGDGKELQRRMIQFYEKKIDTFLKDYKL